MCALLCLLKLRLFISFDVVGARHSVVEEFLGQSLRLWLRVSSSTESTIVQTRTALRSHCRQGRECVEGADRICARNRDHLHFRVATDALTNFAPTQCVPAACRFWRRFSPPFEVPSIGCLLCCDESLQASSRRSDSQSSLES